MAMNYRMNFFDQGHFGDITIYTKKNGQVIYRIRRNRGGRKVKTFKTQCIRVRWANLVRLWQVLRVLLRDSFSDKERNQSDCNRFMQVNFDQSDIYLSRPESKMGYCIATDVTVSSGKLPPICFTDGTSQWISDICVGSLVLDQNTTVGELTQAIEAGGNPAFEGRDDLFLLRLAQRRDTLEDFYYCTASNPKLELRADSRLRVMDIVEPGSLATVEVDGRNYLALPCQEGVFTTLIHSRTAANGRVHTSTQRLLGKSQLQRDYQSASALLKAIESYGALNDQNYYRYGATLDPMAELRRLAEAEANGGGPAGGGPGTVATYTITPRVEPDASFGTITMVPSQMPVPAGTQVRLTATPAGGKRLVSWSDGSTEATITVTADSDRTVTATFAAIATGGGNGGGLGSKSRKSRKSGKSGK